MCLCLKISPDSYYKWLKREARSVRAVSNKETLKVGIRQVWEDSFKIYGSPKITYVLARKGINVSQSYVARLMNEMGIKSIVRKKYVVTTDSKHSYPVAKNLLNRNFQVQQLGLVWVSDITYIPMGNKWLYLTSMIDLADRKVVGWSLSRDMTVQQTVYQAWNNARNNRSIQKGFTLHSDRGIQYASNKFTTLFSYDDNKQQSMSRKGNCWDNAVAESFFKTIKCELIYRNKFDCFEQAFRVINQYIHWYNNERIHQGLGYATPLEKEQYFRRLNHLKHAA